MNIYLLIAAVPVALAIPFVIMMVSFIFESIKERRCSNIYEWHKKKSTCRLAIEIAGLVALIAAVFAAMTIVFSILFKAGFAFITGGECTIFIASIVGATLSMTFIILSWLEAKNF